MYVELLPLKGLTIITPKVFRDGRGFFLEQYRQTLYEGMGPFVQDNLSFSTQNTIRGLHYQSNPGQAKLISCLQGKIWDVVVDLREGSTTFGKWFGIELDDQLHQQLFIPIGFAHGFCALENSLVSYKVSAPYDAKTERTVRWDDPQIGIDWPVQNPILSERDRMSPFLREVLF